MEKWKQLQGYESYYSISDKGRVKSNGARMGGYGVKFLKLRIKRDGYVMFRVSLNKKQVELNLHRQVALHFLPNPDNKPQINHKDFNKENNFVENLEWVTAKENIAHLHKSRPELKKMTQARSKQRSLGGLTATKEGKKAYQKEYFKTYKRKDR
jgi:hypothetical protein